MNTHVVPGDLVFTHDRLTLAWIDRPEDREAHVYAYADAYKKHEFVSLKTNTQCLVLCVMEASLRNVNLFYVMTPAGCGWLLASDVAPFFTANEPVV